MNIDELVHDYAKEMDMSLENCIKWLSTRHSLEIGCEVLGINVLDFYKDNRPVKRQDMEPVVDELAELIKSHGFEPPQKWESGLDKYMDKVSPPERFTRDITASHKPRMTVLKDLNRRWYEHEVEQFVHMWQQGLSLEDIARSFNRDYDEVALLAIDRAREGHIEYRPNGVWGNRRPSA